MKKNISRTFLCFIMLLLTACGFHLRGYEPLPPQLKTVYLETTAPYGPLAKTITQMLTTAGVTLATNAQSAPLTLKIIDENNSQQLTSQGTSGQLSTYLITYTINFEILDSAGNVVLAPQTISTNRNYSVSSNQVLGDTSVQQDLHNDMQRDVVNQMMMRLRTRNTALALQRISD